MVAPPPSFFPQGGGGQFGPGEKHINYYLSVENIISPSAWLGDDYIVPVKKNDLFSTSALLSCRPNSTNVFYLTQEQ